MDGVTGLTAALSDGEALARGVLTMLDDPPRAQAMGDAGRRLIESSFSLEAMLSSTISIYEECL
jgi:glycosyltransferase involved in cell wall biosynthesis